MKINNFNILLIGISILVIFGIIDLSSAQIDTQDLWWWGNKDYYNYLPISIYNPNSYPLYNQNLSFNLSSINSMNADYSDIHFFNSETMNSTAYNISEYGYVGNQSYCVGSFHIPYLAPNIWINTTYRLYFNSSLSIPDSSILTSNLTSVNYSFFDHFNDSVLSWNIIEGSASESGTDVVLTNHIPTIEYDLSSLTNIPNFTFSLYAKKDASNANFLFVLSDVSAVFQGTGRKGLIISYNFDPVNKVKIIKHSSNEYGITLISGDITPDNDYHLLQCRKTSDYNYQLWLDGSYIDETSYTEITSYRYISIASYIGSGSGAHVDYFNIAQPGDNEPVVIFDYINISSQVFDLSDYPFSDPEFPNDKNISANISSNYIKWYWNFTNASLFIDGSLIISDTDIGYYILKTNENEKHRIDVYDPQNSTLWYSEVTSYRSFLEYYLLMFIFMISMIILGYYISSILPLLNIILFTSIITTILSEFPLNPFYIFFSSFLMIISVILSAFFLMEEKRIK